MFLQRKDREKKTNNKQKVIDILKKDYTNVSMAAMVISKSKLTWWLP